MAVEYMEKEGIENVNGILFDTDIYQFLMQNAIDKINGIDSGSKEYGLMQLIKLDFLRRLGLFNEAKTLINEIKNSESIYERIVSDIINYQIILIDKNDIDEHFLSDIEQDYDDDYDYDYEDDDYDDDYDYDEEQIDKNSPEYRNLIWKNGGREISEALIDSDVMLFYDAAGNVAEGETVKFRIFAQGKNKDDFVDEVEGQVKNGIVKVKWEVIFKGGKGSNAEEEIEELGYTIPNYYFVVQYGGVENTERSQLLVVRNVVQLQLVDDETEEILSNIKYAISLSDGTVVSGITDDDGYMEKVYLDNFAKIVGIETGTFDFRWKADGSGGIVITGYVGTSSSVTIPEEINGKPVTLIGFEAFAFKGLTSVTIPDSVTDIGPSAFARNRLTSITIPSSVIFIYQNAFAGNRLTSIDIPNSVQAIGDGAFARNRLTDIIIPNSVTAIGSYTFFDNQLTSVTIPDSVTEVWDYAFFGNPLTSITIGSNVSLDNRYKIGIFGANTAFDQTYTGNGSLGGTYIRPNAGSSNWTLRY
ncbi:MAG: leucine-rich repeat domain-containing protein [Treponema sp.]|nr:leucine-rich repeat domain-containing protein [Treponema sp.]